MTKKFVFRNRKNVIKKKISNNYRNTSVIWKNNPNNNHIQWVKYSIFNKVFFYCNTIKKNSYEYGWKFTKKKWYSNINFLLDRFKAKNFVFVLYVTKGIRFFSKTIINFLNILSFCYHFFNIIFSIFTIKGYKILIDFNTCIIMFNIYRLNMFKTIAINKYFTSCKTKKLLFCSTSIFRLQQVNILFNYWPRKNKNLNKIFSFYLFFRTYSSIQALVTLENYFIILRPINVGKNVFVFYYLYIYYFFTLLFFDNYKVLLNYCFFKKQKEIEIVAKNHVFFSYH